MKIFNKVVIIGTGLIGGSLGLVLKKKHLVGSIIGLSRRKENAALAKKLGAIDRVETSLDAVRDADLVILATPVDTVIDIASKIANKIKKDCTVIDVGSTKEKIVAKLSPKFANFIGCHPLAGSEKRGAQNLSADIFIDSICIVTPTLKTGRDSLKKIKLLWKKVGTKVVVLSPKQHDQILAFTSHLPHIIAFSLIGAVPEKLLKLSSGGLKDSTRISGSDANLWSQVFLSNRKNLSAAISSFQTKLDTLKLALKSKDKMKLTKILEVAKKKREKIK